LFLIFLIYTCLGSDLQKSLVLGLSLVVNANYYSTTRAPFSAVNRAVCQPMQIQWMLNISKVLCVLLKQCWFLYDHSRLYIDNTMYISWFAMLIISVYTAQNTIHLEFNFCLLIQCVWQNFNRDSYLNGSYGPAFIYWLGLCLPFYYIVEKYSVTCIQMTKDGTGNKILVGSWLFFSLA
jgi:hypothetical protein